MSERFSCADPDQLAAGLDAATTALSSSRLVVLPTDTVYGVAADAFDPAAVSRLLRAKGRGRDVPPPVLIASPATLDALASDFPSWVRDLAEDFWPGPLTLVCREQSSLSWDLGETRGTVALRMPDHEVALQLIRRTGPLAVSSANTTGQPAAALVDEARDMLGETVTVYLDGGPIVDPVPSSILDITSSTPRLLRAGAVSLEQLQEYDERIEVADA